MEVLYHRSPTSLQVRHHAIDREGIDTGSNVTEEAGTLQQSGLRHYPFQARFGDENYPTVVVQYVLCLPFTAPALLLTTWALHTH